MRSLKFIPLALVCLALGFQAHAAEIIKVLPHLLDENRLHTLSPSLYERDAYQAYLQQHPEHVSALRFDVQWKGKGKSLKLRIQTRGSLSKQARIVVLERKVKPPFLFSKWSSITLAGEPYKQFGKLVAWRATLWSGDQLLAEQKSFLW